MTPLEITNLIVADLDSRGLKNPGIRKNALNKVWEYMKNAGEFLINDSIVLPDDKSDFKERLARIKGYKLNSAESSVINMIYSFAGGSSRKSDGQSRQTSRTPIKTANLNPLLPQTSDSKYIEENLINANYLGVTELDNGLKIPARPGLYCIKLRNGVHLPKEFGIIKEEDLIYIGQASVSLRERLWEEELNHRRPATFFRSVGAILGYFPPKGSLVNKKNKKNYRFSEEDTQKIIEWMRSSLMVNFLEVNPVELDRIEQYLIKKYRPLVNIKHNPTPNLALKAARKRCKDRANEKP